MILCDGKKFKVDNISVMDDQMVKKWRHWLLCCKSSIIGISVRLI